MRTVRRLYFYAVAFVSLEIVLWGLIGLGRSIVCPKVSMFCGGGAALAEALALILVGVPFFGFHWWFAQRISAREMDERAAGVRAFFLYAVLLSTLIPVVQNILALTNRSALTGLRLSASRALVGGEQAWSDNLIAILMNLLVAAYFYSVLRTDWNVIQPRQAFADLRRLYRYIWVLYGLGLLVAGLHLVIRFLLVFDSTWTAAGAYRYWGVNGMVTTLLGAVLWAYAWTLVQNSMSEQAERESYLRLGLLYLLSLAGAVTTIVAGGAILNDILRLALGMKTELARFLSGLGSPIGVCVPAGLVWAYYGNWLTRTLKEIPEAPRRAGMRRLYFYILSAVGLIAAFAGLAALIRLLVDFIVSTGLLFGSASAIRLADAFTYLLVGLPLWLVTWRQMQTEALADGDGGDHARRSIVRKAYLYLAIFASVVGGMVTAIALLTILLRALFGAAQVELLRNALTFIAILFQFGGLGLYHGLALGRDGKLAARALGEKYAAFPVLIFDPGDGFGADLLAALQKATPGLPAMLQPLNDPVADSVKPQAVILPSDAALNPPEALRGWLSQFNGSRLVVPRAAPGWHVIGQAAQLPANQAAQAVRQLAEGQEVRPHGLPGWQVALYILAAVFGLPFLASLIGTLVSAFMQ
jgi:hypothetical protein